MFFTNKEKAQLELKIKELELELEIKQGRNKLAQKKLLDRLSLESSDRVVLMTAREQQVTYRKAQAELWKDNATKACTQRDEYIAEVNTAKEEEEKAKTSYKIIKAQNEVLSKVSTNVQPVLDENITLKAQVDNIKDIIGITDNVIEDLRTQLSNSEQERNNLIQTITQFKTRESQQPVVIQPQIIEPVVLSSKK